RGFALTSGARIKGLPATGHLWVDVAVLQYCSHLVYLVLRFATHKWKPVRQWLTICSVSEGNVLINKNI
ncbi:hypothetical protein RFI99_005286, partial [Klebsiella pneumoniae]